MFEHDQPRSARASLADGDQASESSGAQLPVIENVAVSLKSSRP